MSDERECIARCPWIDVLEKIGYGGDTLCSRRLYKKTTVALFQAESYFTYVRSMDAQLKAAQRKQAPVICGQAAHNWHPSIPQQVHGIGIYQLNGDLSLIQRTYVCESQIVVTACHCEDQRLPRSKGECGRYILYFFLVMFLSLSLSLSLSLYIPTFY